MRRRGARTRRGWPVARDGKQYEDIDPLPKRNEEAAPTGVGYNPPDGPRVLGAGAPLGPPQILSLYTRPCRAH
jgi:hypothetical protein